MAAYSSKTNLLMDMMDASEHSHRSNLTGSESFPANGTAHESSDAEEAIAEKENRAVFWSRAAVIVVLLLCGSILGGISFMIGRRTEENARETQFQNLATEVIALSQEKVLRVFDVLDTLSVTTTSFSRHNGAENEGYPDGFLTLPDVEHHFGTARNVSQAFVISYLPRVEDEAREIWERYSVQHQDWILEANNLTSDSDLAPFPEMIWYYKEVGESRRLKDTGCSGASRRLEEKPKKYPAVEPEGSGPFSPVWLISPPPAINDTSIINYNMMDKRVFDKAVTFIEHTRKPTFLDVCTQTAWFGADDPVDGDHPQTVVVQPVFADFQDSGASKIIGHLSAVIPWNVFFEDILNDGSESIHLVMSNTCDETFSYEINGREANFLGEIDAHNPIYDDQSISDTFADFANPKDMQGVDLEHCVYTIHVFPTDEMVKAFETDQPVIYVVVVLSIFLFTAIVFVFYDFLVGRRQKIVMSSATKTQALVSSLFPKNVQDRIFDLANETSIDQKTTTQLGGPNQGNGVNTSAPIADLFPDTTIMFADIVGFTAWSSMRQPTEVFTLLETLYYEFDKSAKKSKVFKVETIGDCYVAAKGVPEPAADHHIVMAKFAQSCMTNMRKVTRQLEITLGVGTADLGLRVGLHSGPCTAGVLRGEKARFQLFGDTMNTAARMESTGMPNKIHISTETADMLIASGKSSWITPRDDKILAKGKGILSTYFLVSARPEETQAFARTVSTDSTATPSSEEESMDTRFIDYNTEVLKKLLTRCSLQRKASTTKSFSEEELVRLESETGLSSVLDEYQEVIPFSRLCSKPISMGDGVESGVELDTKVSRQLRQYVQAIADLYDSNCPFHNFHHCSHVVMSTLKLISANSCDESSDFISDPLVQLAMIFGALIHDADHSGVPNATLVKEEHPLAAKYENKSVAEQNSVDVAWKVLMSNDFHHLRRSIYSNQTEFLLFRSVLVNAVIATDIVDKELGALRKARWNDAFCPKNSIMDEETPAPLLQGESPSTCRDRKTTIMIEHIIQASDIAHTMQHWHIYRKWNSRLFAEMWNAHRDNRSEKNPADSWYEGELGFYDYYIIPLAKKLRDSDAFGASSKEFLSYALKNRSEWERTGMEIVAEMKQTLSGMV